MTGAMGVSCERHLLSSIFLDYFFLVPPRFAMLRPVFACPFGQLRFRASTFPRTIVSFALTHHTACGALACTACPQASIWGLFPSGTAIPGCALSVEIRNTTVENGLLNPWPSIAAIFRTGIRKAKPSS